MAEKKKAPVCCPNCGSTSFKEAQIVAQYQWVRWNETEGFFDWEESEHGEITSVEDVICAECSTPLGADFLKGHA